MIKANPQNKQTRRPEVRLGLSPLARGLVQRITRTEAEARALCSRAGPGAGSLQDDLPDPDLCAGRTTAQGDRVRGRTRRCPEMALSGVFLFNYIILLIISWFLQKAEHYRIWITLGGRGTQTNGFHSELNNIIRACSFPNSLHDFFSFSIVF